MNKKILIVLFSGLAVVLLAIYYFSGTDELVFQEPYVVVRGQREGFVEVEIADTKEERKKGLMYREQLGEEKGIEQGMLFIFPQSARHSFWMKNTLIPLDIIHISEDKKVVDCLENIPPCEQESCPSYKPSAKAQYVLEVNAGFCQEHGIKNGDMVKFNVQ